MDSSVGSHGKIAYKGPTSASGGRAPQLRYRKRTLHFIQCSRKGTILVLLDYTKIQSPSTWEEVVEVR